MDNLRAQPLYCEPPAFAADNGKQETAAQANGRRYEEKALPFLNNWAKVNGYAPKLKPWIQYFDAAGRLRWCQPDFLAIGESTDNIIIVEVKHRHTRDAFRQLHHYRGIIAELHPNYHISCLEMCRYFDILEYPVELFPAVRPHELPFAAVLFDPQAWTQAIN